MEHGLNNQQAISAESLDPLTEDVVAMRSKSAEPLGRAKSPSKSRSHRKKRSSAVERPQYHFHDRQGSDDKKDRRRRHSSSSRKRDSTTDLSINKLRKTPDPIPEGEPKLTQKKKELSDSIEPLVNTKRKEAFRSPAEEKQEKLEDADERDEKSVKKISSKEPTREITPEIIRSIKVSKFVDVPSSPQRSSVQNEIVKSSKSSKFVNKQSEPVEGDSSKKKKEKKKSKSKKTKRKRRRKSSSSSLSSYSYSDSDASIIAPASVKKPVSKLASCEVPESSNRPPPPPPRPPRSDQTMDSHIYENYPIHKNGSKAPATMTAEIIDTPVNIHSPLKRKNSDLKIPPSPSNSPMLKRKSSFEVPKKSPEKEAMNPQFKLAPSKQPQSNHKPIIKPSKGKSDAKLDRRVSVAASIFGDVIKRRPPTHRHVDNRPQNPLDEIKTQNFTLRKTFEGGAINLEKPVPGLGRVVGEEEVVTTKPRPSQPLIRRQSAPPGYLNVKPEPNILDQLNAGIKLRSVPKPVESRVGLGRVVEDTSPVETNPLPQIPRGRQNSYSRLLSDIKEIGDQIEDVFDDVVEKVVNKSQPSTPTPPPPPPPTKVKHSIPKTVSLLDQIKNRGFKLRKVPPPKVKVHLVTETDHLDVPSTQHPKTTFEKVPPATTHSKKNFPAPSQLSRSAVSSLEIPPQPDQQDDIPPSPYRSASPGLRDMEAGSRGASPGLRDLEAGSRGASPGLKDLEGASVAADLTPSPIRLPSQFVDSAPDGLTPNVSCFILCF